MPKRRIVVSRDADASSGRGKITSTEICSTSGITGCMVAPISAKHTVNQPSYSGVDGRWHDAMAVMARAAKVERKHPLKKGEYMLEPSRASSHCTTATAGKPMITRTVPVS